MIFTRRSWNSIQTPGPVYEIAINHLLLHQKRKSGSYSHSDVNQPGDRVAAASISSTHHLPSTKTILRGKSTAEPGSATRPPVQSQEGQRSSLTTADAGTPCRVMAVAADPPPCVYKLSTIPRAVFISLSEDRKHDPFLIQSHHFHIQTETKDIWPRQRRHHAERRKPRTAGAVPPASAQHSHGS